MPISETTVTVTGGIAAVTVDVSRGLTGATGSTGQGVPTGGTTGQVLSKSSNADYATTWTTGGVGDLVSTNNLSDLADAATALVNLGAATSAQGALADTAVQPAALDDYLPLAGGTMTGDITFASAVFLLDYYGNVPLNPNDRTLNSLVGVPIYDWSSGTLVGDGTGLTGINSKTENLTNKTLTSPTVNGYTEGVTALGTVISAATINISAGTIITAKLTASTACTFTMPTPEAGLSFLMELKQASTTGNGTATFTGVDWGAAGTYVATAAAGKMDMLSFATFRNSAESAWQWGGTYIKGFTPT